ncbi:CGP-CTERM sorting domain-containing protein [Thermococcus sp.]|uniref:CGP-CTERM sorting domain-containing protein n=1 Tax=Thermococcus sp. TaxID=35749 RepID=UPI00263437F0|nr:CGP-CTERM sorting domain-containing protein [Thermococcus sp.]
MKGRILIFALIVGFLIIFPAVSASDWKFDKSSVHFYMYGLATCPHCRHMKELIPAEYGYGSFTYYELLNNKHNDALFRNLSSLTGITGVPAIGIVYNGTLVAVIEGEYNVSATPEIVKAALKNNGTLLFVGGRTYILPHNSTESMKVYRELYYIFVKAGEPTTLTTSTSSSSTPSPSGGSSSAPSSSKNKGICGPAAVVGLAAVPLLLRRRR